MILPSFLGVVITYFTHILGGLKFKTFMDFHGHLGVKKGLQLTYDVDGNQKSAMITS